MKKRITFVCHGNICRSPAAELIFKRICRDHGRAEEFEIRSGAATNEEIINGVGAPVYPPMAKVLESHGYDCNGKRAVLITDDDYKATDLFVVMDYENLRDLNVLFRNDPDKKIKLLMSFCEKADPESEVEDPWYTHRYEQVFRQIEYGCGCLYESLTTDALGNHLNEN